MDGSSAEELIPELARHVPQHFIELEAAAVLGDDRRERREDWLGYLNGAGSGFAGAGGPGGSGARPDGGRGCSGPWGASSSPALDEGTPAAFSSVCRCRAPHASSNRPNCACRSASDCQLM